MFEVYSRSMLDLSDCGILGVGSQVRDLTQVVIMAVLALNGLSQSAKVCTKCRYYTTDQVDLRKIGGPAYR